MKKSNLKMIKEQVQSRGINNANTIRALQNISRDHFVIPKYKKYSWEDRPLPIGYEQTISQPYIVALMTSVLDLTGTEKLLEIGTGCGYQTAILAQLAHEVHSIEIIPGLYQMAKKNLDALKINNIYLYNQDGSQGLQNQQPFDAILSASAPKQIPKILLDQLNIGGKMIIPVGEVFQELTLVRKTKNGFSSSKVCDVKFVPMTGKVV